MPFPINLGKPIDTSIAPSKWTFENAQDKDGAQKVLNQINQALRKSDGTFISGKLVIEPKGDGTYQIVKATGKQASGDCPSPWELVRSLSKIEKSGLKELTSEYLERKENKSSAKPKDLAEFFKNRQISSVKVVSGKGATLQKTAASSNLKEDYRKTNNTTNSNTNNNAESKKLVHGDLLFVLSMLENLQSQTGSDKLSEEQQEYIAELNKNFPADISSCTSTELEYVIALCREDIQRIKDSPVLMKTGLLQKYKDLHESAFGARYFLQANNNTKEVSNTEEVSNTGTIRRVKDFLLGKKNANPGEKSVSSQFAQFIELLQQHQINVEEGFFVDKRSIEEHAKQVLAAFAKIDVSTLPPDELHKLILTCRDGMKAFPSKSHDDWVDYNDNELFISYKKVAKSAIEARFKPFDQKKFGDVMKLHRLALDYLKEFSAAGDAPRNLKIQKEGRLYPHDYGFLLTQAEIREFSREYGRGIDIGNDLLKASMNDLNEWKKTCLALRDSLGDMDSGPWNSIIWDFIQPAIDSRSGGTQKKRG